MSLRTIGSLKPIKFTLQNHWGHKPPTSGSMLAVGHLSEESPPNPLVVVFFLPIVNIAFRIRVV